MKSMINVSKCVVSHRIVEKDKKGNCIPERLMSVLSIIPGNGLSTQLTDVSAVDDFNGPLDEEVSIFPILFISDHSFSIPLSERFL